MPYIDRENGNIVGLFANKQYQGQKYIEESHADMIAFRAAEAQAVADKAAEQAQKAQDIIDNLPSWVQVENNINNIPDLAGAKAFLRKLTRVVYWLAKNSAD